MPQQKLPRGIRNDNPGNLIFVGQKGARKESGPNGRFAVFPTPQDGLRALREQLMRYFSRGTVTVASIIAKWAPPSDGNDTTAYSRMVAQRLGVDVHATLYPISSARMETLIRAIVQMENGQEPYGPLITEVVNEQAKDYTQAKV